MQNIAYCFYRLSKNKQSNCGNYTVVYADAVTNSTSTTQPSTTSRKASTTTETRGRLIYLQLLDSLTLD